MNRTILFLFLVLFLLACNKKNEQLIDWLEEKELIEEDVPLTRAVDYGTPWNPKYIEGVTRWDPKNPIGYPSDESEHYPGWGLTELNWPLSSFSIRESNDMMEITLGPTTREVQSYNLYFGQYIHVLWRYPYSSEWYYYHPEKLRSKDMYEVYVPINPHRDLDYTTYLDPSMLPTGRLDIKVRQLANNFESRQSYHDRRDASLWGIYEGWGNSNGYITSPDPSEDVVNGRLISFRATIDIRINCPMDHYYYTIREPNGQSTSGLRKGSHQSSYTKELYMQPGYEYKVTYGVSISSTSRKSESKTFIDYIFIKEDSPDFISVRHYGDFFFDDWK